MRHISGILRDLDLERQRRTCSRSECERAATVYASDTIADGWADYYCGEHIPRGWMVEKLDQGGKCPECGRAFGPYDMDDDMLLGVLDPLCEDCSYDEAVGRRTCGK